MPRHVPEIRLRPVIEADLGMFRRFVIEPGLIGLDWPGFRDPDTVQRRFDADSYLGADDGRLIVDVAPETQPARLVSYRRRHYGTQAFCWETGIALLLEWRGQGIGWRAQAMFCSHLFENTPVQRIEAATHAESAAEQRSLGTVPSGSMIMNQMVQCGVPESRAKDRLLARAVENALSAGIADLSLREIAAAIGTSHRMLIYHFGSRQGLLVEVARAVEAAQRTRLPSFRNGDPAEFWREIRDARFWPQERLFFELYSYALGRRPGTEGFLDKVVESWIAPLADNLVELGWKAGDARTDARLGVAVVRGLLLDLLATGDIEEADRAYDRFASAIYGPGLAIARSGEPGRPPPEPVGESP